MLKNRLITLQPWRRMMGSIGLPISPKLAGDSGEKRVLHFPFPSPDNALESPSNYWNFKK
jgi:hypothetical protein